MTTYVDYSYYIATYKGTLSEDDFHREVVRATAYVNQVTMGRISSAIFEKYADEIKMATCAACEVYHAAEKGGEIASESVGSWSRTYSTTSTTTQQKLQEAVETFLMMTGLLFRGCMLV